MRGRVAAAVATLTLCAAASAPAVTIQSEGLRISALAQVQPYKLPRDKPAPIAVFVAGHLQNPKGGIPPQLRRMRIAVNRHGLLQSRGLPTCPVPRIQPASTERALLQCGPALIGSGQFWANIVLPDQGSYPTQGRLLVFNGRGGGKRLILAHLFTSNPFNTSYVIRFSIRHIPHGTYGTELKAFLPATFGTWGYISRIKLNLVRKYRSGGKRLSYFNAGCAAPKGVQRVAFPLAYAEFKFARRAPIAATVPKTCGVEG